MSFSFVGMTLQQVEALPSALFATLSTAQLAQLDGAQARVLSGAQIVAIPLGALAGLSVEVLHAFSATQAAALTGSQIQALSAKQLNAFDAPALNAAPLSCLTNSQIQRLAPATIGRLSPATFDAVIAPNLAGLKVSQGHGLTLAQIASLAPAQAATFSAAVLSALSAAQFDALSVEAIAALSAGQLAGVGAAALNGLSAAQLDALDVAGLATRSVAGLRAATLNAFTACQMADFSRAQVRALTTAQVRKLSSTNLDALDPIDFGGPQVAGLKAAYISALCVAVFDESIAKHAGSISLGAIAGVSVAQIESMSVAENSTISVSQFDVMNFAQQQAVLAGGALIAEAQSLEVDGTLSYSAMLQVLRTAAVGGMNAIKFGALKLLASELGESCGFGASAYVEQIAKDVIDGNSANAFYNGGASTAAPLGNLTASSSQAQMDELIGKWFLGADLPSLSIPASVGSAVPSQYQAIDLPLFGPAGPSYLDVNQGNVGDGYFLAALAETAYLDPGLIKNMIQENPNGTYSVRFEVNGAADYVTVNDELPVMLDGYQAANGSTLEFANSPYAWSLLIEKAYAQLVEQSDVTPGDVLGAHGDAYADLAGGDSNGISVITGDSADFIGLASGESAPALASLASGLQSDLSAHLDVLFASSSLQNGIGNLVNNQMFEVLAVNVAGQSVLLQNPWNGSGLGSGKAMQFWESLSDLALDSNGSADPAGFYVAKARPVT
jgi:hypothetical protein